MPYSEKYGWTVLEMVGDCANCGQPIGHNLFGQLRHNNLMPYELCFGHGYKPAAGEQSPVATIQVKTECR